MKRVVVAVLVAAMVLVAGCGDVTTNGDGIEDDAGNATELETEDATETATETGDAGTETDDEPSTDSDRETDESSSDADGELEIHHIDVGQADATLLIEPGGETMLVDSGDWRQDGEEVIDYLDSHGVDRIDHLVATHAHADHIGGHSAVIDHYETEREGIGAAYDSGVATTTQTYERYLDAIEAHDVDLLVVEAGDSIAFGEARFDVFNPPAGDSSDDLHANSVSLAVEFGDVTYLTTGDAEGDAERRMAEEYGDDLAAEAYQAGHHGSSTSSTAPFVDRVAPETAIVSSAYGSQYGHPADEVLSEYAERGIETYWTAVHGDVVLTTDGVEYSIATEHEFSTDPEDLLDEKPADETQDGRTLPGNGAVALAAPAG